MWQTPVEEVEHALQQAAELTDGSGDEASLSILRTVRMALAQEHGYLLEATQRARSGPHSIARRRLGQGAGQGEITIASSLCTIGRAGEALELLGRAQQAAHDSGDMYVVVRCQSL